MPYQLRKDLSLCEVDGHMVLMDVAQDRYFRLTSALERALRIHLAHGTVTSTLLDRLVANEILVEGPGMDASPLMIRHKRPTRSAIEQPSAPANRGPGASNTIETMWIVWSVWRALKNRTLKIILEEAHAYRSGRVGFHEAPASAATESSLTHAARQFAHARRYVPIEPTCLLDSLSLLRFLSRRGLPAEIVFGVTLEPFAAHCWVQAGDVVLNETLSDAHAYTPIRTI